MSRIRRRVVLAAPLVVALPLVSGLTGCLGPTREEQAYAGRSFDRCGLVSHVVLETADLIA